MIQIILLNILLTLPILALAQTPVPQVNGDCPWRTYKSGDFCIPHQSSDGSSESYIPRQGGDCPYGYNKAGDYCHKKVGDYPESIPRKSGQDCPHGWRKNGDYCWKASG